MFRGPSHLYQADAYLYKYKYKYCRDPIGVQFVLVSWHGLGSHAGMKKVNVKIKYINDTTGERVMKPSYDELTCCVRLPV